MPEHGSVQPSLIQPSLKNSFMTAFPSASRRDVIRRELGLEKIQEVYNAILELEDDPTDALGISLEKMMADREVSLPPKFSNIFWLLGPTQLFLIHKIRCMTRVYSWLDPSLHDSISIYFIWTHIKCPWLVLLILPVFGSSSANCMF